MESTATVHETQPRMSSAARKTADLHGSHRISQCNRNQLNPTCREGVSLYQDGATGNAELTFVKDAECNSRLFGFSNIATLRIPG
jgi:hypothetical protein